MRTPSTLPSHTKTLHEETKFNDQDDDFSVKSGITEASGEMKIPTPPLNGMIYLAEWLERHFETYINRDFINFLFLSVKVTTIDHLDQLMTEVHPKDLFDLVGKDLYDHWRKSLIDL
jgi:hypothetical protein